MAVTLTRKFILSVCCLILVVIGELYALTLHYETRAIVFRAHFVILVQGFLFMISRFLWRNLTDFLPASSSAGDEERDTARVQQSDNETRKWTPWKVFLLVYFVLSHLSYFTNVFLIGRDPHWFAMLTYCCLGSYLQLATAVAGLKLMNYAVRLLRWRSGNGARRTVLSKRNLAMLAVLYATCAATYGLIAAAQVMLSLFI